MVRPLSHWSICTFHDAEEFGSPERMYKMLLWVKRFFDVISMSNGLDLMKQQALGVYFSITFDDADLTVYKLLPTLVELQIPACLYVTTNYVITGNRLKNGKIRPAMSRSQLEEWVKCGMTIGCHTVSHPHLPKLNKRDILFELNNSVETLQDWTGQRVEHFAYPYGDWDGNTKRIVEETNLFRSASIVSARYVTPETDRYALPRYGIRTTPIDILRLRFLPLYRKKSINEAN